tara:strand:+ start:18455 stop:18730 length:276 start_codon:yes stop_codon:yes gene_type:complete
MGISCSIRAAEYLQLLQVHQSGLAIVSTNSILGLEIVAHRRSADISEKSAEAVSGQVDAGDTGGLALRHAMERRGNGRRHTAGATAGPALH